DFESGRLVEFWNNVFMQYHKDENGSFQKLSNNNVDTGAGFERVVMIVQGVSTVFDTDLFQPLIAELSDALGVTEDRPLKIMADHLRAAAMLIQDGVRPSNKDQGYILRRLLRRALLHSQSEEVQWIDGAVDVIVEGYVHAYPELEGQASEIKSVIREEAAKFQRTLAKGKKEIVKLDQLTAKAAFDLYQSYGFPFELSKEFAASQGIKIEDADFETEFEKHKNLSRTASAGQFSSGLADHSEMTVKYHTATHLLHQALRTVLGESVQQRGSNITPERLRFDFAHPEKLSPEEINQVENLVNEQIARSLPVSTETMSPDSAHAEGALGFFGHKYGDTVSVYTIGDFSKEICTGPHVGNTSELGHFKIAKEEAVSAGVRRVKAILE
ncbi:MAG: alanyl-tRNA synthetase, partial [Patescibacteria group bacterium]|nr:alanyl-tRNA synthetase [Patescibacteria group bacterium]